MSRDSDYRWLLEKSGFATVGDLMNRVNSDMGLNAFQKRQVLDMAVDSGLTVKDDAAAFRHMLGGGLVGSIVSNMLGASPFWNGAATLAGAAVANSIHNSKTDPHRLKGGYMQV